MTAVAGTTVTYGLIGLREDLEDSIYMISPEDTPFLSMASRARAKAVRHEWQIDTLAAAAANAVAEGDDASFTTIAPTTRVGNRLQISRKTVIVSGTAEAVDAAGRDSEYEYQFAKRVAELKRDMELILTNNQASSAGTNVAPRTLGSLEAWIATNRSGGAGTTHGGGYSGSDVVAETDGTAGALRSLTEALLKTQLSNCYTQGGNPKYMMVGPFNKQEASENFAGIATQYRENKRAPAVIIATADVYVSDFGEISIFPNRFSRDRTALILDMEMWAVAYLRPFRNVKLSKTGDAEKGMAIVEYTLVSRNEAASAKITDLRTS
jgi:hypothetical protein